MMNKKAGTLGGVFLTLLLVMGLFFGMFGFIAENYDNAGITEDSGFLTMNDSLVEYQENISANIAEIQDTAQSINEADGNIIQVAWNGLTGIGPTIRVFFSTVNIATGMWQSLIPGLNFIPTWVVMLVQLGIVISIILLILGALKGESKT